MKKRRFTEEQIAFALRQAEAGTAVAEVIRKTLAQLGERICTTPEEFKAWSQNLAHEGVLTAFVCYGAVKGGRQAEILRGLQQRGSVGLSPMDLARQLTQALQQEQARR